MTDVLSSKELTNAAPKSFSIPAGAVKIEGFENFTQSPAHNAMLGVGQGREYLVVGAGTAPNAMNYDVMSVAYYPTLADVYRRAQAHYRWDKTHFVALPASWNAWAYFEAYVGPFMRSPWAQSAVFLKNLDRWIESFPVPSKKVPGLVAYFQDTDKRARDIQTPIKPGKYLKKFFGDILDEDEIQTLAMEWSNQYSPRKLNVTQDADEIERVYRGKYNGSCMYFKHGEHNGDQHPARVYAGPDLGIAYIGDTDSADARCLVWPSKKLYYPKFYGDYFRMESSLINAGYTAGEEEDFEGARLQRIPYGGGFILPYLDTHENVTDTGSYLVLDDDGEIGARNTNGLSDPVARCGHCEEITDRDELVYSRSADLSICESCRDRSYFYCEEMDDYYHDDDGVHVEGGRVVSEQGVRSMANRDEVFWCEETERYYLSRAYDHTVLTDGRTVELSVAETNGYFCAFSDQFSLDHESKQELSDGRYVDMDMVSNQIELDAWCDSNGVTLVGALKDDNQIELDLAA